MTTRSLPPVVLLFGLSTSLTCAAQDPLTSQADLQNLVEDVLGYQDLAGEYETQYENLTLQLAHPLDLNKCSAEELRTLYLLNETQVHALLKHRHDYGHFLSVYELQAVPGFDSLTIERILPFVKIPEPYASVDASLLRRVLHERNNYLLIRHERTLEQKRGFLDETSPEQKFQGSPDKIAVRFRVSRPGDFSAGFTLEKDEGEKFAWQAGQPGFDYASFHLQLMNKGKLKNLIAGDYQLQAGQGLLLGSMLGFGKGSETVMGPRRTNLGALPYTSSNENSYRRGVAATYNVTENLFVTLFYARSKRDAAISTDSSDSFSIQTLQATGLHRNEKEIAGKHLVTEQSYGALLNTKIGLVDAGLVWHTTDFDRSFVPQVPVYNPFAFRQAVSHNFSGFLNCNLKNFSLFSEAAKSLHGGAALVTGLLGSVSTALDVSLVYRNYQKDFQSYYSNAFGETSTPQNETGMYWGWKYKWNKKYSLAGYIDLFRSPWLRFQRYAPSQGHEWLLRATYQAGSHTQFYFQCREESKLRNRSEANQTTYRTDQGIKRNYLLHLQVAVNKKLRLRTRLQFSTYAFDETITRGLLLLQDVTWREGRLSISARHALFDTDDYDNRQYAYENDVWLAFSIPAYSGTGVRDYAVINYSVSDHLTVSFRYARTRYTNRDSIGSGLDRIEGSSKRDVKFQVRLRL